MKAYKVEILVIDHDGLGEKEIKSVLENTKYPNYCIYPEVMGIESRDIGEWTNEHLLNFKNTLADEYNHLFGKSNKVKFICTHCGKEFYSCVEDIIHITFTNKRFCSKDHLEEYLNTNKGA